MATWIPFEQFKSQLQKLHCALPSQVSLITLISNWTDAVQFDFTTQWADIVCGYSKRNSNTKVYVYSYIGQFIIIYVSTTKYNCREVMEYSHQYVFSWYLDEVPYRTTLTLRGEW